MATLAEIRTACDGKWLTIQSVIDDRQATYATAHNGRYWQGLVTHLVLPSEGVESPVDVGGRTPTDQPTSWPASIRSTSLPMALRIDVYDGPRGQGYTVTFLVMVTGNKYRRISNSGPETERQTGWHLVAEVGL